MAKTNFSKVEDILGEGLRKITVKRLLKLADVAAGLGQASPPKEKKVQIGALKRDLVWFFKHDKKVYHTLKIKKKEWEAKFEDPESIDDKELKELMERVEKYKKKFYKEHPKESDESLVEAERLKHINKRFNVSEKWLPLH